MEICPIWSFNRRSQSYLWRYYHWNVVELFRKLEYTKIEQLALLNLVCESAGTRTQDTKLKRLLLYQLSYGPMPPTVEISNFKVQNSNLEQNLNKRAIIAIRREFSNYELDS